MFRIFISYSTDDLEVATALRDSLVAAQIQVFLAEYSIDPGGHLKDSINQAIEECDLFIVLWSDNARNSDWVSQEVGIAKQARRVIIPILVHDGIEPPGFLSDIKYLRLHADPQACINAVQSFVTQAHNQKNLGEIALLIAASVAFVALMRK